MKPLKIAFVASQGGHAGQMKLIFTKEVIGRHQALFVTETEKQNRAAQKNSFQEKYSTYFFRKDYLLALNPFRYFSTFLSLRKLFRKEQVTLVVTNGAQLSIPAVIAAKSLGIRVIFLDTFIRVKTPNWSARFCYFFSDRFLVQHESMKKKYGKKAEFHGSVL
ncbi:hypothetical protein HYZ97_00015 [Candidatus Pacearchaeota archaeon]|nr:hypothetical protein [Candidatus Pacearchaeota archaeon]